MEYLVAVASELEGHAAADALVLDLNINDKEGTKQKLIKALSDEDNECVITGIDSDGRVYQLYGYFQDEIYALNIVAAPLKDYKHVGSCTG